VTRGLAKKAAGIAQERSVPKFAPVTFRQWYAKRKAPDAAGRREVILWADTFNNHFHPATAIAAVEVLEAAGCSVSIPRQTLCCGRPLYDFGMLDQAKKQLQEILGALRAEIRAGIPIVGLEPSCIAVFRDELPNLFPNDEDAKRLTAQMFTLSEYLEKFARDFQLPRLPRKAIVQGHCHHKAVMGFDAEEKTMARLGLDARVLDSGCCGMAGAFGFEEGHYDVSKAVGERVLLPAVRKAAPDELIIADGFSCREQITQETDRKPIHLAQAIQMGLRQQNQVSEKPVDARAAADVRPASPWVLAAALAACAAGAALAARAP
jgi:Fe-S oxidoreductase